MLLQSQLRQWFNQARQTGRQLDRSDWPRQRLFTAWGSIALDLRVQEEWAQAAGSAIAAYDQCARMYGASALDAEAALSRPKLIAAAKAFEDATQKLMAANALARRKPRPQRREMLPSGLAKLTAIAYRRHLHLIDRLSYGAADKSWSPGELQDRQRWAKPGHEARLRLHAEASTALAQLAAGSDAVVNRHALNAAQHRDECVRLLKCQLEGSILMLTTEGEPEPADSRETIANAAMIFRRCPVCARRQPISWTQPPSWDTDFHVLHAELHQQSGQQLIHDTSLWQLTQALKQAQKQMAIAEAHARGWAWHAFEEAMRAGSQQVRQAFDACADVHWTAHAIIIAQDNTWQRRARVVIDITTGLHDLMVRLLQAATWRAGAVLAQLDHIVKRCAILRPTEIYRQSRPVDHARIASVRSLRLEVMKSLDAAAAAEANALQLGPGGQAHAQELVDSVHHSVGAVWAALDHASHSYADQAQRLKDLDDAQKIGLAAGVRARD